MEILGWFGFFQPKFDTTEEEPWSLLKNTEYLRGNLEAGTGGFLPSQTIL